MRAERISAEEGAEATVDGQGDTSTLPPEISGDPIERGFEDAAENIARNINEEEEEDKL